ncbi:ABC transporter ATP-binding protein/permease [Bacillus cereus]|uniref:ABC transporter ATP-binding protein n=1 Tax=Bacillus TaxID=1386 RepID=UPI0011A43C22|nr:ABC transporter ATP-binding protein [Bacillus cereus]MCU5049786.1 ABC transporter ATP-binding protein/permease [Bacillus cereus]MCU5062154.1 ABC transporter ATP-binding protein/permease [Bacillus cereus]MCU5148203.1 ABC transporter ATP-binding protein/permease [Bacillus cereus]MCU5189674.1 ABC transporter ATP-binding protein/permease [Bacillus cereus]MCU5495282.1 ABC transporter ATP-binding protein/permease [Bacillus cereus]
MNAYKVLLLAINDRRKKLLLSTIIIVSILFTVASLVFPLLVKDIVDEFSVNKISLWMIGGLVLFLIAKSIIESVNQYIIAKFGNMIIRDLQKNIYTKMLHFKVDFFDEHHSGELSSRIVNDTEIIKDLITYHIPKLVTGVIMILGGLTLTIILDWKLTIVILIISPFIFGIIFPLMRKTEQTGDRQQKEISVFIAKTQETFKNIKMVKASTAEKHEKSIMYKCIDRLYNANLYESKIFAMVAPLVSLLLILGLLIVVGYGAYRISVGTLSISTLIAFVIYAFQMMTPMSSISGFIGEYHKANGAIKSLNTIMNNNEIEQTSNTKYAFQNEVSFKQVNFGYKDNLILKNITFNIKRGEALTIVGPSGSGKTTLINLLEKFYFPTNGEITIDNVNINQLNTYELRKNIGIVSQGSSLISGTILENLLYGLDEKYIDESSIREALRYANLEEFVEKQKDKLDTNIGESGDKLSGGEKQRLNIARLFLKNPDIILLDEPTSNLDIESRNLVLESIKTLTKGKTVIKVTHNLEEVKPDDNILFLEDGEIVCKGSHERVSEINKRYKEFISMVM